MKRVLLIAAVVCAFHAVAANAQTSHTVTLNWTQSISSGLTANKVYRSTTSGSQGAAIFTSASPVTTYIDSGPLTNGTTYYYCVTAFAGTNNESPCSNQASGAIPTAPAAPTALTITIN